ncbi:Intraflagellar transport protein [Paragonimus heterotremus]|uniref:Intraflagellar transport protein 122 homolog n=1 Tax=Paragonimus heterotremus TaxID=100268 RepID=A0A8J4WHY4_9TREM|nr:Intraflagellar transport protein [Paragonimus heterotremus]
MDCIPLWNIKVRGKDGSPHWYLRSSVFIVSIWDLCYSPDGTKLLVAAGCVVLVYRSEDADLLKTLRGHKEPVYCVNWAYDGKYFSSGSADKCVIIWKSTTLEGLLKYRHNDAIQCLSFNPSTILLASCACSDFVFWTLDQQSVTKTKLPVRATCCSWKADGQYLAIGLYNGVISIRNKATEEIAKIERPGAPIIWRLRWSPSKMEQRELLAVVDWNQKLSFYQLCGKQIIYGDGQSVHQLTLVPKTGKDRTLSFDPCDVTWFGAKCEAVAVCGSDQACTLFSAEGSRLASINKQHSWVCLYRDRYAYRESLTDVVVQHLSTQQKARIKCRDYVKKIAVYKNRLAIQLSDKILIYEPSTEDPTDMHYRVREKLIQNIECQLLVVTTHNLVVCQDNRLTSLNFQGIKEREWILDGSVRYIRIIGGPATRETLLVGLKNGQAMKIILDNAFPIQLVKLLGGIRCVDISHNHDKLGVIDDNSTLSVFCLRTKELLFQEPNVISLAWSTTNNELLSFSGEDTISIKAGQFPSYSQHVKGVTVGFCGSFIYCLQDNVIHRMELSLSPAMYSYLEAGYLDEARKVACHGLTDPDWVALGQAALTKLNLEVAKFAYVQLEDAVMLSFIQQLEERRRRCEWSENESCPTPGALLAMGDVATYLSQFTEAATLYTRAGHEVSGPHRVVEMYTDLRRFDEAREAMNATGDTKEQKQLMSKHADWARSTNEHHTATKMYMDAGEFDKAIELAGEHKWTDMLLEISRRLDKGDRDSLERCAKQLAKLGEYAFAAECYAKYGDVECQLSLYVEARNWEEAFSLIEKHPEQAGLVYKPYAQWLAENDKFEEAQVAFAKAGLQSEAIRVLEQLATCAANESRFEDAAFYHWKLSMQCLEMAKETKGCRKQQTFLDKFYDLQRKADVYYVYSHIHRYLHEPFASQMTETYFNMARYLINVLQTDEINAVSKAAILFTLAKHGRSLGAYKLARLIYERLQNLHLPQKMRQIVEMASLSIRTKPFVDSDDVNVICYRCSTTNPLLSNSGNRCSNCREPFVYSFISLEQLPLVEFVPEKGLTHEKVLELLSTDPGTHKLKTQLRREYRKDLNNVSQTLKISTEYGDVSADHDPFTAKLLSTDFGSGPYLPVQLDAETLRSIPASEVIVIEQTDPLQPRYYKSVLPEVIITQCTTCHKLFNTDDYELAVLQKGHCPFCRTSGE